MTVSVGSSTCPPEALLGEAQSCTELTALDRLLQVTGCGLTTQKIKDEVTLVSVINQSSKLAYWPPALCEFTALSSINLSGNAITFIPQSVQTLTGLKVLNLARNNLTSVPPELCCLSSLTELDLSRNELRALHPDICTLKQLQVLNVMGNQISQLPEQFGDLSGLIRLGLKSNQLVELPASFTHLANLVELYITDNQLTTLPQGFGNLKSLVKLQASFNPFTHLPADMWQLPELEMFRLAVGDLQQWPADLTESNGLPKLAWCSLGRNPAAAPVPAIPDDLARVDIRELVTGIKLGQGASGEVFRGKYKGTDVAIKIFVADISPDGSTREEMAINCAVKDYNLTKVLALITDATKVPSENQGELQQTMAQAPPTVEPSGSKGMRTAAPEECIVGMVLELFDGKPLAGRPTSEHLLRCKWPDGQEFSLSHTLGVCYDVAGALRYLHSKGICHGDVYAHNIMVNQEARAVMCDFGAAHCYDKASSGRFWECMEVRAFGLFMKDMADRTYTGTWDRSDCIDCRDAHVLKQELEQLVDECLATTASERPTFSAVKIKLMRMLLQFTHAPA